MTLSEAEKLLRTALWELGVRYRTAEKINGVFPTLSIPRQKIAVFVTWELPTRRGDYLYDMSLRQQGWVVLRYKQKEVEVKAKWLAYQIWSLLRAVDQPTSV